LQAIEALLAELSASGRFCHDDLPDHRGHCLVTQVTPAKTFQRSSNPIQGHAQSRHRMASRLADGHPARSPDAE